MKDTRDLIEQVQSVHPEYKKGDVGIVIHAAIRALGSLISEGNEVKLPGVGIINPTIQVFSKGAFPVKTYKVYFRQDPEVTRSLRKLLWPENKDIIIARRKHQKEKREESRLAWLATLTPEEKAAYEQRREYFRQERERRKKHTPVQERSREEIS